VDELIDGRKWFDYSLRRLGWRGGGLLIVVEAFSEGRTFGCPHGVYSPACGDFSPSVPW